jgi:hypothetical protein
MQTGYKQLKTSSAFVHSGKVSQRTIIFMDTAPNHHQGAEESAAAQSAREQVITAGRVINNNKAATRYGRV